MAKKTNSQKAENKKESRKGKGVSDSELKEIGVTREEWEKIEEALRRFGPEKSSLIVHYSYPKSVN